MPRQINRLSALAVSRVKKLGLYPDGGGLYLQIAAGGSKSWIYRFMLDGRARTMGLGSLLAVPLADARGRAAEARALRASGIDPIEARNAERATARLNAAKAITFKDAAERYIEAHAAGWRNAKHIAQWRSTLETYAYPVFGSLAVQDVDVAVVMKVLEPIWTTKTETASRVRGRIESVLDWAAARGYRKGENPARWRGHLKNLLPERSRVRKPKHHPALPYVEIGDFMKALRAQEGGAGRVLEFVILTAARTGEVIGARWSEIDMKEGTWIVPAERIKGGREHRVPLSAPALGILETMADLRDGKADGFVFPGRKRGRALSNMAMLKLLERMERDDLTVHGFRSTFRDWAAERTNYPREVAEAALAHVIPDKVEAAYRRGDLFEKRRRLMNEWARFCAKAKAGGKVVPMRAKARGR